MSECIIWEGKPTYNGYGRTWFQPVEGPPRLEYVHRAVYELLVGPIPKGMTIDHLCGVKLCANYQHLEIVTLPENIRRGNPYRRGLRQAQPRTTWRSREKG